MSEDRTRARGRRHLAGMLVAAVLVACALAAAPGGQRADAADLDQFRAGDIISDALFFDGRAMSEADVQRFLDQKGAGCTTGADGTPCLKAFRQDTTTRPADAFCAGYVGAPDESAARVIAKVGQSCGISQRVLLVMLQKEQSLVTNTGSSLYARRYREAMGFACPDTAACNPAYKGFFNQVYSGARQFKNYAANPKSFGHRAGQLNTIRFHPDSACGTSPVFIYNQATAGLYNYTPYQPNAAALRAGYGEGNGCSTYGNRNFFHYFTDWFGSTHESGAAAISAVYYRLGHEALGAPLTEPTCGLLADGCWQNFVRGAIYWTSRTGAHPIWGGVLATWHRSGRENGVLGYPITDELPTADGAGRYQVFEKGAVYWSERTGAHPVRGGMRAAWEREGKEGGFLGFPTGAEVAAADGRGRVQPFQGGSIYYTDTTGAYPVVGEMRTAWAEHGGEAGALGYPVTRELPSPDGRGRLQRFEKGLLVRTRTTGVQRVRGAVLASWVLAGAETGELGYPTAPEAAVAGGGALQTFEGGTVFWTARNGAHWTSGAMAEAWAARGGAGGALGLPVGDRRQLRGGAGLAQDFQHGALYALASGPTYSVHGALLARYRAEGAESGGLGLPVGERTTAGGTVTQRFERGIVHWAEATGAQAVRGAIYTAWRDSGGLTGSLGAPLGSEEPAGAGVVQRFQKADVYFSGATWTQVVRDPFRAAYQAAGGAAGPLGLPVSADAASGSARVQEFRNGTLYSTAAGGTHPVWGGIGTAWQAAGGLTGSLGAPLSGERPAGAGVVQKFQDGEIYWSAATGAQMVRGSFVAAYATAGGASGPLGLPVAADVPSGSARVQKFQRWSVYWTSEGGAHPVWGGIATAWLATGGLSGPLGGPQGGEVRVGTGSAQTFRGGVLHWSPVSGVHRTTRAILDAYAASGASTGPLGEPVSDVYIRDRAPRVDFDGGAIVVRDGVATVVLD